jgi:hypothetical protein
MDNPFPNRRDLIDKATRYLFEGADREDVRERPDDVPPRLTLQALEQIPIMSRSRERILANLEEMYREAFARATESGDAHQMATLDFAYRREQLYFEILLDVRDAIEKR